MKNRLLDHLPNYFGIVVWSKNSWLDFYLSLITGLTYKGDLFKIYYGSNTTTSCLPLAVINNKVSGKQMLFITVRLCVPYDQWPLSIKKCKQ